MGKGEHKAPTTMSGGFGHYINGAPFQIESARDLDRTSGWKTYWSSIPGR
jgi:hypothetical protein